MSAENKTVYIATLITHSNHVNTYFSELYEHYFCMNTDSHAVMGNMAEFLLVNESDVKFALYKVTVPSDWIVKENDDKPAVFVSGNGGWLTFYDFLAVIDTFHIDETPRRADSRQIKFVGNFKFSKETDNL